MANSKIVPYRRQNHFGIISIVFTMIFIYLVAMVVQMTTKSSISIFEVEAPANYSVIPNYSGIITRKEIIVQTKETGYVNYFIREENKASVNETIYTTDETGAFAKYLAETYTTGENLTKDSLHQIKNKLVSASLEDLNMNFQMSYKNKEELSATVLDSFLLSAMSDLSLDPLTVGFSAVTTDQSGFIMYRTDTYDGLTSSEVTAETLHSDSCYTKVYKSGEQRVAGEFAYKLIPDDSMEITFPISEQDAAIYKNSKYIKIELTKVGVNVTGTLSIFTASDGTQMATVSLSKYGSSYLSDRYLDFKIVENSVTGFKVPVSAVISKSFLLIPKEYLTKDSETGDRILLKETVNVDRSSGTENVPVTIYNETDTQYYISSSTFSAGEYIVHPTTGERYLLSVSAPLNGVYNINKGYCIFDQIEILSTTSDNNYYIIASNTKYGISAFDHIVLNATLVTENQIIY